MNLISHSQQVKAEADSVLQELKIHKQFSQLGEVKIVGSYALDLMWQKDIDLYVINECAPSFQSLFNITLDTFADNSYYYYKIEHNSELIKPNLPSGVGLFIKLHSGWKFDFWFLSPKEAQKMQQKNAEVFKNYTPDMRQPILELKKKSIEAGVYNKKFGSYDLYKAVIENNMEYVSKYF